MAVVPGSNQIPRDLLDPRELVKEIPGGRIPERFGMKEIEVPTFGSEQVTIVDPDIIPWPQVRRLGVSEWV